MNPQYITQYGGPPQNFQNKPAPPITSSGFQNVPLGQPKSMPLPGNANIGLDSFPLTTASAAPPGNQFGMPLTTPQTNVMPPQNIPGYQNNHSQQIPLQKSEISTSQFPAHHVKQDNTGSNLNQNGLSSFSAPPTLNINSQKFNQVLNNVPPSSQYNQMPKLNNDFSASNFTRPPMPGNVPINNDLSTNHMPRPPLIGQTSGQPAIPGQFTVTNQPQSQGQPPSRPTLPAAAPPNQFIQQPLKGQYPPNQFIPTSNLPQQMQNMNINSPRQYENELHMPPPNLDKQGFAPKAGPMPGFPPMPGQIPTSAHSDMTRTFNTGMPPLPGQPPMPGSIPGQQSMPGLLPGQQPMPGSLPGQPPMPGSLPGQPPMPGSLPGVSGPYPQHYQQPQQPKRLDPDQMPSPIQVMQDDQRSRSGAFCTNQKGLVPPLVTTDFTVQDQGNASPRFIRSTMYNVPITQDLMKQTSVPFGLIISPMARTVGSEYSPPIVNFGELGPVRCIRCKAYMSPYMQFIDAGRRFQCLFCKATTDVPAEYFQHLDHTGQRIDRFERPELILGTYEFTATADYCRNNKFPKPPAIIFLIDVSYNNVKSGLVHLLCSQMKEIIKNLPIDQDQQQSNMRVGFITYNSCVHFYNIKGALAAPQMLVVGDIQDMFMPLLDGFLCTPEESEIVIDALMQQIPAMFGETRETETILLPAILAGLEALKASECSGKLLVFHSSLPIAEAPGKLKNRDDRKLLGTDKERTVLTPQSQSYSQLGQDCVAAGCSVDLFLFNNSYIDVATIGQVSRLTGGEIFKYTYFQADVDGSRLISDIITNISRPIAFDTVMRVRTSTGIRATDFYGHLYMSNTTDMEIAAIDCDKAVAVEIKHDDKLTEEDGVYIQVALLYTSCSGQRRLRVINLSLKTCSQMADLYRCCELDTIINFFGKQSMYKLLEHNPKSVKDSIVARAAQILANYRKNCASPSSAGQLILPECMKLLPLYVNCILKSDAMSGGSDITLDDRSFVMHLVMTMDIPTSVSYFYPRFIPLNDVKPSTGENVEIPPPIRTTIEKTNEQGAYILENGLHMFFYIGLGLNPEFCQQVFGVHTAVQIDIDKCELPVLDNPLSITIRSIIKQIRIQRHRCMRLTFIRQREKLESVFKHFLVEDRGIDGSPSYVDFLCHMHKEIRTILS